MQQIQYTLTYYSAHVSMSDTILHCYRPKIGANK